MAETESASSGLKRRSPGVQARASRENVKTSKELIVMNNATAISVEHNSGMSYATLIPVTIGEIAGSVCQVVNAKDLHICLRVKDRFDQWIRRRAAEYGFREGEHFCTKLCKSTGGRRKTEFTLSMTMALNLAIVEKTEIGQRIRDYFIDCEKRLRQIAPESASEALRKALSPEQQHTLSGKVHSKVACLDKARQRAGYSELWSSLKAKHQVARYQDIAQGEFEEACGFVDGFVWEGEWLGKGSKRGDFTVDWYSAQDVSHLLHHVAWVMFRWNQGIAQGVKAMNPGLYSSTFEHFQEVDRAAKRLDKGLAELVRHFQTKHGGLRPNDCLARGIAA